MSDQVANKQYTMVRVEAETLVLILEQIISPKYLLPYLCGGDLHDICLS